MQHVIGSGISTSRGNSGSSSSGKIFVIQASIALFRVDASPYVCMLNKTVRHRHPTHNESPSKI